MARKVLNRKALREENEAAEAADVPHDADDEEGETKVKKAPKKPAARKSRAKVAKVVRLKAFWGVYNQSMKEVAVFDYANRKAADKKATDLTASAKTPHFVQIVKRAIDE